MRKEFIFSGKEQREDEIMAAEAAQMSCSALKTDVSICIQVGQAVKKMMDVIR